MAGQDDDELGKDIAQDLGSLVGPFGFLSKRMFSAVAAEWRRNNSTALHAAEVATGMTREQIQDWVALEPRAIPLYLKVLWAAGMNGHDKTLAAMGAVLGAAARATATDDEVAFEEAELALRAMSELTPRHFRILAVVAAAPHVFAQSGDASMPDVMPDAVAATADVSSETANQCLLNLAGAGLVVSMSVYGGTAYPVTQLGRAVVEAAEAADGSR